MAQFTVPRGPRRVIAMKAEATAGVDVFAGTYTSADVIQVDDSTIRWALDPAESINRMTAGNLGAGPSIIGARTATLSFSMPWRGTLAAYDDSPEVVPAFDRPIRGCRHGRTFTDPGLGTASLKYAPTNTEETFTIYVVTEIPGGTAHVRRMVGCLGTHGWSVDAGGALLYDFTFRGSMDASQADITYVAGAISSVGFPRFVSASWQIGATNYAPRLRTMRYVQNNDVPPIPAQNSASGVAGFFVANRLPEITINPEAAREADSGWWTALDGSVLKDLTFTLGGTPGVQFNRLKFQFGDGAIATLQVVDQSMEVDNGIVRFPTRLRVTILNGNDDYSYTAD